jgi:P27 family predicted phage terminase small subunit
MVFSGGFRSKRAVSLQPVGCNPGFDFQADRRIVKRPTNEEAAHMGARGRKSAADLDTPTPVHLVTVPAPEGSFPAAPTHLSAAMREWWEQVTRDFDLDHHHLLLLQAAADAWDRMVMARSALLKDGLTVAGKDGPKTHPATTVERDSRLAFARLVRELDLDCEAPQERPGWRPPAIKSNRRR